MGKVRYIFLILFCITFHVNCHAVIPESQLRGRGLVRHDDFVVNAIPKCGTHLIMSCVYQMINKKVDESGDYVEQKDYTPHKAAQYVAFLQSLRSKPTIHKTHVPYFPYMEDSHLKAGMKWIFFYRDPRDAIVSLVFYMDTFTGNRRDFMQIQSSIYDRLNFNQKINAVMTGTCCTNYLEVYYKPLMGWTRSNYGVNARFEDLIGPRGGGSLEAQLHTIGQIAAYLNVKLTDDEMLAVAEYTNKYKTPKVQNSMGRSYLHGQVGNWREFFDESNKQVFKKVFGKQLIELGYELSNNW